MSSENDGVQILGSPSGTKTEESLTWETGVDYWYKFCSYCKPFILNELEEGSTINKIHDLCNARKKGTHKSPEVLIKLSVVKLGRKNDTITKIMFTNDSRRKLLGVLKRIKNM